MAKQVIGIGSVANDGTGDSLRVAGGKINDNFTELYDFDETLHAVAVSGDYSDLINKPSLATVATTGAYSDLSGTPSLQAVATSGSYNDLDDLPNLGTAAEQNVGTSANNVVQLDGTAKLPAVDGSQLTNLPAVGGDGDVSVFGTPTDGQFAIWTDATTIEGQTLYTVPAGGTTGQVLSKIDGTNGNTEWTTPSVGGGGSVNISGTPTNGQVATWVNSNTIQGVAFSSFGTALLTGATFSGTVWFSGTSVAGLRLKSLSNTQRNALTPSGQEILFNSTTNSLDWYDGGAAAWYKIVGTTALPTQAGQYLTSLGSTSNVCEWVTPDDIGAELSDIYSGNIDKFLDCDDLQQLGTTEAVNTVSNVTLIDFGDNGPLIRNQTTTQNTEIQIDNLPPHLQAVVDFAFNGAHTLTFESGMIVHPKEVKDTGIVGATGEHVTITFRTINSVVHAYPSSIGAAAS